MLPYVEQTIKMPIIDELININAPFWQSITLWIIVFVAFMTCAGFHDEAMSVHN